MEIQTWPISKLVPYIRNLRKNDQRLGMTELPVIRCDEWSEAQVRHSD
jgi:hypothetical protein